MRAPLLVLVLLVVLLLLAAGLRSAGVLDTGAGALDTVALLGPLGPSDTTAPRGPLDAQGPTSSGESAHFPGHGPDVAASRAATETKDGIG